MTSIEEKPKAPQSIWAVTRLYFTDFNRPYLSAGNMHVEHMGRGYAWLDTGTTDSLLEASEFVATLERRRGLKICCPEEIALRLGHVTPRELEPWLAELGTSAYADYVRRSSLVYS